MAEEGDDNFFYSIVFYIIYKTYSAKCFWQNVFLKAQGGDDNCFLYNVLTNVFVKYIKQKFLSKNVFSKKTAEEGDDKERGNFLQTSPYFSMG